MNAPRHREHDYPEEHPNRPAYFPDITLGNIIAIVVFLASAAGVYAANESRITRVETLQVQQEKSLEQQIAAQQQMIAELKQANEKMDAKIEKVDDKIDQILLQLRGVRR